MIPSSWVWPGEAPRVTPPNRGGLAQRCSGRGALAGPAAMTAGRNLLLALRFAAALGIVAVAHLVDLDTRSRLTLWADIFNAGHVVMMGVFSLVMLGLSSEALSTTLANRFSHYLVAFLVTVAVGALSEIAQIPGPRDADALDIARDAAGAFCFLGLRMIGDKSLAPMWQRWRRWARPAAVTLLMVVLLFSWKTALSWIVAFYQRDRSFPVLATFDSPLEHLFRSTRNAIVEATASPEGWTTGSHAGKVGKVVFHPSTRSGFAINRVPRDWSAYQSLQCSVYVDSSQSVELVLQLEDSHFDGATGDRFTYVVAIEPGANYVTVPLDTPRTASGVRLLDMQRVTKVYFLTRDTSHSIILYIDNIHLR